MRKQQQCPFKDREEDDVCRLTDLVVLIYGGEFPHGVWKSHSTVVGLDFQEVPLLPPLLLVNVGLIGEAVQLGETLCREFIQCKRIRFKENI